jgi:hypothetical protein
LGSFRTQLDGTDVLAVNEMMVMHGFHRYQGATPAETAAGTTLMFDLLTEAILAGRSSPVFWGWLSTNE